MYKFNNFICILILYVILLLYTDSAVCAPKRNKSKDYIDDDYNYNDDEFDLNYDQRQNGTENIRIVVDGVVIAVAGPESSSSNDAIALLGGLFHEILSGSNYDDDDLLTGEHLSNGSNNYSSSGYQASDNDKLEYEFEQIDKSNSTFSEKGNKTMNNSTEIDSSTGSSAPYLKVPLHTKESSKQLNISHGKRKQHGEQRRSFRIASLLKSFFKQQK